MFGPKKIFGSKKFWSKVKKFHPKNTSGPKKKIENIFGLKKNFWSEKNFGVDSFFFVKPTY